MQTNSIFAKPIHFLVSCLTVFSILSVTSCSEDDDGGKATITIVNATEGSLSQDLYIDQLKVTGSQLAYLERATNIEVRAGDRHLDFAPIRYDEVRASTSVYFAPGKYYTVFYSGGKSSAAILVREDDRTPPASGTFKATFYHLSPGASGTIDIGMVGQQKIANGLAYRASTGGGEFPASAKFQLFVGGSSVPNTAVFSNLNLLAGHNYNVYITGASPSTMAVNAITIL